MFKILTSYKCFVVDLYFKPFIFQVLLAILIDNTVLCFNCTLAYRRQNLLYYSLVYKLPDEGFVEAEMCRRTS
jgi:hypothetical protein